MGEKTLLALSVARRLADVSQDELAQACGCTQSSISYWEQGLHPLPRKYAVLFLKYLKPRLKRASKGGVTGAVLRGLTQQDLRRPWDELLLDHVSTLQAS